ncbi:NADPH-dependent FMN reductase [Sporichthya sp.]|uniref:NADPH-dependent FMN reductase n=1 Tax=Sporichthya sp. TaxID=65475 RepID=UPI0017B0E037|nr:NADPH-dependent FMN reductase [Sporichthya sp.]MBA3743305.1 NAD(P)H-dependent oxidoreductase [Sporichthya sp.]
MRILLVSGSTRAASTNTAALRTVPVVAPPEVEAVLFDGLAQLPAFNPDHDHDDLPASVRDLRAALDAADAVLFSTPEYAGALPGAFKNLLDWTVGAVPGLDGKLAGWVNVAAEGRGQGAHAELATVLGYVGAAPVPAACVRFAVGHGTVGLDGTVADPAFRTVLTELLAALATAGRAPGSA